MNVRLGGEQRSMHATCIPDDNPHPELQGKVQIMVFDKDLSPDHSDFKFAGKPKGMRRVLEERGLMAELTWLNGGKPIPGDCSECKQSRKEQERIAQENAIAMAGQDKSEETDEDYTIPAQ
ncbi:hypothetical protein C0995_015794, partial [Termitomyces sp. Mi166